MALLSDGFCSRHSYEPKKWKDIKNGFTHFANNDIVIAKITPCFQNRKSAVVTGLPNGFGAGTTELHVLRDNTKELFMPYFLLICKTQAFIQNGVKNFSGTAGQQRIGKDFISKYLIPVPPVSEQERIVQRLHLLEPLLISYENAYDSIVNQQKNFPAQLKRSILQYAVQGKLVSQNPADEPAAILLEHIRAEKEKLIKSGKIKRDKHESFIFRRDNSYYEKVDGIERCIDDEIPFKIPKNWEWCRLGTILQKLTDGTHSTPKYAASGIPFISVKDISSGKISFESTKFISEEEHELLASRCDPHRDDILLTKVGTTGIPVLVDTDRPFSIFVSVAQLRFSTELLDKFFLIYLLKSPLVQTQCRENTKGVGNKNWVMRDIANTLICIPPLAEQKRIQASLANVLKSI